jgi:hypothetical protein
MQHVCARQIVDELAAAADKAQIFKALDRLANERIDRPHVLVPSRL